MQVISVDLQPYVRSSDKPMSLTLLIIADSKPYAEFLYREAGRYAIRLLHAGSREEGRGLFGGRRGRGSLKSPPGIERRAWGICRF